MSFNEIGSGVMVIVVWGDLWLMRLLWLELQLQSDNHSCSSHSVQINSLRCCFNNPTEKVKAPHYYPHVLKSQSQAPVPSVGIDQAFRAGLQ